MVKITSGFSGMGGSTEAFINLTNYLNNNGIETCFYGPHEFHLDKCNGKLINNLQCKKEDVFILHYSYNIPFLKNKIIFSCHERAEFFDIRPIANELDYVHFVSEKQKLEHNLNIKSFVLPNILPPIICNNKPNIKTGGVIGSIDRNKNTHISIQKALEDNCSKVLIYGNITDTKYFEENVKYLIDNDRVYYCGYNSNKSDIYSSLTDVYHYSKSETWGYIEGECYITGTNFHKSENLINFHFMDNESIIKEWIKIINQ